MPCPQIPCRQRGWALSADTCLTRPLTTHTVLSAVATRRSGSRTSRGCSVDPVALAAQTQAACVVRPLLRRHVARCTRLCPFTQLLGSCRTVSRPISPLARLPPADSAGRAPSGAARQRSDDRRVAEARRPADRPAGTPAAAHAEQVVRTTARTCPLGAATVCAAPPRSRDRRGERSDRSPACHRAARQRTPPLEAIASPAHARQRLTEPLPPRARRRSLGSAKRRRARRWASRRCITPTFKDAISGCSRYRSSP